MREISNEVHGHGRRVFLGKVFIRSLNQIGESVKLHTQSRSFILSRKASVFDLYTIETDCTDYRIQEHVDIIMKCGEYILSCDRDGLAAASVPDTDDKIISDSAILRYCKRKFDSISVSFSAIIQGQTFWLRHSNSKLKVCVSSDDVYWF